MRAVGPLLCLALLSGCAGGTDAALTAQDAKSKIAVKDSALTRLASGQLTAITQAANAWLAENGSMAGFADDLRANQPTLAAAAVELTDASANVAVSPGHCLAAALPSGPQEPVTC